MVLNIAIIGAGPVGCTLACVLQKDAPGVSVTVFEAEQSLDFRSQGGALDLHEHTGIAALKRAGLFEDFLKYARYDGEALTICDKNLLRYVRLRAGPDSSTSGRPEIDRPRLREILYNRLKEGTIRWNTKVKRIDEDRTIHFTDGSVQTGFDLIVGADGVWSKVRPFLSSVKPFYSGIAGHSLRVSNAEKNHPELYKLVDRGSVFAFSDSKSLMGQYNGDGSLNVSTWSVRPEDWQSEYDTHDAAAVRRHYEDFYSDWSPELVELIRQSDDKVIPRDLYMLPIGHSWLHRKGVTIIGDAAHCMTPFAGEGVNLGMEDALKLADAILAAMADGTAAGQKSVDEHLDGHIAQFEQDMFKRATATQQLTWDMLSYMFHTPGAPRTVIAPYVSRALQGPSRSLVTRIATPLIYAFYWGFKMIYH